MNFCIIFFYYHDKIWFKASHKARQVETDPNTSLFRNNYTLKYNKKNERIDENFIMFPKKDNNNNLFFAVLKG